MKQITAERIYGVIRKDGGLHLNALALFDPFLPAGSNIQRLDRQQRDSLKYTETFAGIGMLFSALVLDQAENSQSLQY